MSGLVENVAEDVGSTTIGMKCAPFNPTNRDCISIALEMLEVQSDDVLFDLGCGDGRFLIQGCQQFPTITGVGIEYDSLLCARAREAIAAADLNDRIVIHHQNVIDCNLSTATAIFVYLVPTGIAAIRPSLEAAIARGVRVATYVFSIPGLTPERVEVYKQSTKLYLYHASSCIPL